MAEIWFTPISIPTVGPNKRNPNGSTNTEPLGPAFGSVFGAVSVLSSAASAVRGLPANAATTTAVKVRSRNGILPDRLLKNATRCLRLIGLIQGPSLDESVTFVYAKSSIGTGDALRVARDSDRAICRWYPPKISTFHGSFSKTCPRSTRSQARDFGSSSPPKVRIQPAQHGWDYVLSLRDHHLTYAAKSVATSRQRVESDVGCKLLNSVASVLAISHAKAAIGVDSAHIGVFHPGMSMTRRI